MDTARARLCRRWHDAPPPARARAGRRGARRLNRLLLVNLGDAAWADLHPAIDAGRAPMLARLVEKGTIAEIDTVAQEPAVLWAGMMTGMLPRAHGIRDAFEVRPDGGGVQPVGASSWRAPPLWQRLARAGVASTIVSGLATAPASAWPGCTAVDERFAAAPPLASDDWPLAPGCVHPAALREHLRPMRVHPAELEAAAGAALPPRELAYTVSVHAAAIELAARRDWRFFALCYPPTGASEAATPFHDLLIARLIEAAGGGVDVVVVSGAGVLIAAGPGFAADRIGHGVRSFDVAATVLARFGFRGAGGVGRVLPGTVHGRLLPLGSVAAPRRCIDSLPPPAAAMAAIEEIERKHLRHAAIEAVLVDDAAASIPPLDRALARLPDDAALLLMRAQAAFTAGDAATCRAIGATLARLLPAQGWGDLLLGAALVLEGDPAAADRLAAAGALAGDDPRLLLLLGVIALRRDRAEEARGWYDRAVDAAADDPALRAQAWAGRGLAALAADDRAAAERDFQTALGLRYHAPIVHQQLGLLLAAQQRWPEAVAQLEEAVAQAPRHPRLRRDLARATAAMAKRRAA